MVPTALMECKCANRPTGNGGFLRNVSFGIFWVNPNWLQVELQTIWVFLFRELQRNKSELPGRWKSSTCLTTDLPRCQTNMSWGTHPGVSCWRRMCHAGMPNKNEPLCCRWLSTIRIGDCHMSYYRIEVAATRLAYYFKCRSHLWLSLPFYLEKRNLEPASSYKTFCIEFVPMCSALLFFV